MVGRQRSLAATLVALMLLLLLAVGPARPPVAAWWQCRTAGKKESVACCGV
jgi:hypothetical protein